MAGREILIAEDNPADVRLIREALRTLHPAPDIRVVGDGEQALAFLDLPAETTPALLFLDYHLPKTDSREVLRAVKKQGRFDDMAVVILTTSEVEDMMHEAYALGADCYLSKPSDLDAFLTTIRRAAEYWLRFPGCKASKP